MFHSPSPLYAKVVDAFNFGGSWKGEQEIMLLMGKLHKLQSYNKENRGIVSLSNQTSNFFSFSGGNIMHSGSRQSCSLPHCDGMTAS